MEKKFDNWLKKLARIVAKEKRELSIRDFLKVMGEEAKNTPLLRRWKKYVFGAGKEKFKKYLKDSKGGEKI